MRSPVSGSPTCSPSARRTWSASAACTRSPRGAGSTVCATGCARSSTMQSAGPRRARRAARTAATRPDDVLEDDLRDADVSLHVAAVLEGDRLVLDFSGTEPQVDGNLNCPLGDQIGVVLRSPGADRSRRSPSAGAHRPIRGARPTDACSTPAPPLRWRPGTSRRRAASPTSCSRLGPGDAPPRTGSGDDEQPHPRGEGFTYYETTGGGQGACPGADGPSAIHVAMSNTLNTPVEALESEFPVRVRELSVRRGAAARGATGAATAWSASSRRSSRCASA